MIAKGRKPFRSWMFIYAGLVAAIILSGQPGSANSDMQSQGRELPGVANAPLLRRDI